MKVRIPSSPAHIALFLLLAFLCYEAHQLVRHLFGAAFCGGFGRLTFTVATTRQPCSYPTLVTLSGPAFTFGLAWLGLLLLRSPKAALFAYALIFASFAPLRFVQTLTGRGDEILLAQQWFGVTNRLVVGAIVLSISIPPLVKAFRAISGRRRALTFFCSLALLVPLLFAMLTGDRLLFGTNNLPPGLIALPGASFLGISLVVLFTDLIACALFVIFAPRYLSPSQETRIDLKQGPPTL
jgi:hypothetical protein